MRTSVRWLVPFAVAATVAGGVAVSSARADTVSDLPARTPEQVLAAVAANQVRALSGTVTTKADLGLPALDFSGMGSSRGSVSATDVQGLVTRFLSGRNTLKVWTDGETKQRVQLVDELDEFDVIRNGTQLWTYSAKRNEVGKATLPADAAKPHALPSPTPSDLTPESMAKEAIAKLDPTTKVTLGDPERVAGRNAYALTLTPRTDETLVDRIVIDVDAEKSLPLQFQVFARGHNQPAIQSGFTSIDYSQPSADVFAFTPPAGAKVSDLGKSDGLFGLHGRHAKAAEPAPAPSGTATASTVPPTSSAPAAPSAPAASHLGAEPKVTGTGWATVVEFPAGTASPLLAGGSTGTPGSPESEAAANAAGLLNQLTKPVSGGRAMTSRLLTVLITDDGRVLAGSVPVQKLIDTAKR